MQWRKILKLKKRKIATKIMTTTIKIGSLFALVHPATLAIDVNVQNATTIAFR